MYYCSIMIGEFEGVNRWRRWARCERIDFTPVEGMNIGGSVICWLALAALWAELAADRVDELRAFVGGLSGERIGLASRESRVATCDL